MQSILQYHRFKKCVAVQYDRDREKSSPLNQYGRASGTPSPASTQSSQPQIPATPPLPTIEDLEKGDFHLRFGSEHPDVLNTLTLRGPNYSHKEGSRPEPLDTLSTTRTEHQSIGTKIGYAMTGVVARSRTTREGNREEKVFVVGYEGEKDMMVLLIGILPASGAD